MQIGIGFAWPLCRFVAPEQFWFEFLFELFVRVVLLRGPGVPCNSVQAVLSLVLFPAGSQAGPLGDCLGACWDRCGRCWGDR